MNQKNPTDRNENVNRRPLKLDHAEQIFPVSASHQSADVSLLNWQHGNPSGFPIYPMKIEVCCLFQQKKETRIRVENKRKSMEWKRSEEKTNRGFFVCFFKKEQMVVKKN